MDSWLIVSKGANMIDGGSGVLLSTSGCNGDASTHACAVE